MSGQAFFRWVAIAVTFALSGCTTSRVPSLSPLAAPFERTTSELACVDWFIKLDAAIAAGGVADAEAMRLPGFPHLRLNRFLASFRDELDSPEKRFAWLHHLRLLGTERRTVEILNLPAAALARVDIDRNGALQRTLGCGELFANADLESPTRFAVLRNLATIPDDYSSLMRAAGLYPLARIPFFAGVQNWQRSTLKAFAEVRAAPVERGLWREYSSERTGEGGQAMPYLFASATRDALGIPAISAHELRDLTHLHAPIFRVETAAAYDMFGQLLVENAESTGYPQVNVDTGAPTIYARHDFTRYGAMSLLQLTYTLWFPERPADHAFDLLAGKLTGVMVRFTIAPNGEIVMVDSAHACGCYHLFFPSGNAVARAAPDVMEEWAFSPGNLPAMAKGERLRVWVASRTHYLVRLDASELPAAASRYSLSAIEALLTNRKDASTRSLYLPNGLVAGSERGERFFFWPMGITSAGQMRQWGHHATAFVGRRHFDDAHLLERYFDIPLKPTP